VRIIETVWIDHNDMSEAIADWLNNKYAFGVKPGHVDMRPGTVCTVTLPPEREAQNTQPIPEPDKPAYPKRSDVGRGSCSVGFPYWLSDKGKVYDNDGTFVCWEKDLQDG
jgi:hypothetical protein